MSLSIRQFIASRLSQAAALACLAMLAVLFSCGAAQEPTIQSAEQDLKQGNYPAAITAFNHLLSSNPNDAQAEYGLLRAYLETGKYAETETAAKKFLAAHSDAHRVRLALGEAYAATGRYTEALAEFDGAGKGAPGATKLRGEWRRAEML